MNRSITVSLLILASVFTSASQARDPSKATDLAALEGLSGRTAEQIREEMATGNISLGRGDDGENLPEAEITPAGDLIIGGRKVALDADQRALTLAYREDLAEVAVAGAEVGMQGAALAGKVLKEVARNLFTGNTDEMEKRIEAQAQGVKDSAMALCGRLPPLLESQQRLATAVPEFAPYATLSAEDINDCGKDL
jgi:hypothetical protein